jgi:hypothetical protein
MAMIENEIISSVYSEEMYNQVTFLEAKDFSKPENQALWKLIASVDGDTVKMIARISHLERVSWTNAVRGACLGVASYKVAQMGLELVSLRFRRLLDSLLDDLVSRSESFVEKHYLMEIKKEAPKLAILELAKDAGIYLEEQAREQATTYAKERLNDFSNYVQKRLDSIKLVTNGNQ